ncbi:TrkH family potassium uptake protein [bacterium LRH843]|nr:TrkH family potassium uptake protein [bacterium LRH843]
MKSGLNEFLSPFRVIILSYIVAMLIFSVLLYLPISHQYGVEVTYIEALFTSVSAVSVTGLTTVNISETYGYVGLFFLAMAIQLGGIGIMTMGTFVWMLFRKKINLSTRMLIMVDQNQYKIAGLVKLMRGILGVALMIELIGAIVLGTHYLRYFDTAGQAYYQGTFASLSAFTNAGFDLTGESLIPFANDYFVQFVTILLIFSGAIGFPVLLEVKEYLSKNNPHFTFSLFTKITTTTFFAVFVIGVIGIWALEGGHYYIGLEWHQQLFYSLFNSATVRSAGLSVLDITDFNEATLLFMAALMIIGASPSSAGGGIRTTTIGIIFLNVRSFALGKDDVKVFGREIATEDRQKAFIVLSVFLVMLFVAVTLIVAFEAGNDISLIAIIFDAASAFGTCGLSMGITPDLSIPSQCVLMVLMFIGRIGLVAFLFSIRRKERKSFYKYPVERVIIG